MSDDVWAYISKAVVWESARGYEGCARKAAVSSGLRQHRRCTIHALVEYCADHVAGSLIYWLTSIFLARLAFYAAIAGRKDANELFETH